MAASLSNIAAKDGAAATIVGGLLAVDKSGAGTGPFFAAQTLVDTQGVNTATVKAASTAPLATDTALVVAMSPNSVNANGQATMANSAPVVIASNQAAIPVTASITFPATGHTGVATFTTGTTAYAASDVVGASAANAAVDLGVCGISGNNILVTSVELEIDSATIIAGETNYILYLYNVTPASAIVDSSPFTLGAGDRAAFLGKITLPNVVVEGVTTATLYCRLDGINQHVKLSGTDLFGYLVSVGAFTPTARVYKITVHTIDL